MGRKRSKRASENKPTKQPTAPPGQRIQTLKLAVELTMLEIAAGHDGLFRGTPEPIILLGAFHVPSGGGPHVKPLGRELVRLAPKGRFPASVAPEARAALKGRLRSKESDRVVVLILAVEEDSGKDVQRLYAHLNDGARLRAWHLEAAEPAPSTIAELALLPPSAPPEGARVHVLDDGVDLRDACKGDKLIGAGVIVLAPHRSEEGFRVRFLSADARNDWTAILGVSFD